FHSDESKAELLPVAYNQKQIVESSAVVAILGDLKANENGEEVYAELASQGYITDEIKQTLLGQINGAYQ
ncbi:nitroreductase family protein, partial [Mesorhizobium sp. M7A.F.Ca.MR.362.00.0.0]